MLCDQEDLIMLENNTEKAVFRKILDESKVLKILTLGHSLAVDSCHMLALIAAAEGYKNLVIGTLYYSGCRLSRHVQYLTENLPEYNLYVSSTLLPNLPPVILKKVTMHDAIVFNDWDIIMMQGGVFEQTEEESLEAGYIETVQNYVNTHKRNPNAIYGWHMPWVTPTDRELQDKYPRERNSYRINYERYGNVRSNFYNAVVECAKKHILPNDTFKVLIPTATAFENALSSYLTEKDLHRDYAHATDFSRVIASYTWLCSLMGIDHLDEIKLDVIPKEFFKSTKDTEDRVLTDMEKAIIIESVNNALANPLKMTQSQYTEAPVNK